MPGKAEGVSGRLKPLRRVLYFPIRFLAATYRGIALACQCSGLADVACIVQAA